jgi:hypothetical protein
MSGCMPVTSNGTGINESWAGKDEKGSGRSLYLNEWAEENYETPQYNQYPDRRADLGPPVSK